MTQEFITALNKLVEKKEISALRLLLADEKPVDIAEAFEQTEEGLLPKLYRLLPKELASEVFVEMSHDSQKKLINALSDKELADTLNELYYDDTADLIEEMPAGVVKRILRNSTNEDRNEINKLLNFKDDSAGSIMTTEFVDLKKEMTVEGALAYIRKVALEKETVYTCYVTDDTRRLEGVVTAVALLTSPTDKVISDLMDTKVISVETSTDKEDVAKILSKYDYLALPVVDSENRLVGIITVDDAMDVISDEAEEDFAKMAAITPSETPYLRTSVFKLFKTRIPWLLLMLLSATFTGLIISGFENALAAQVVLTMFIPMLMDTGGNCGSQSSVTVIRALSLGEVKFTDTLRVLFKESLVALLCGACLSVVAFAKLMTIDNFMTGGITVLVALTVALTLMITVFASKIIGSLLPIAASKIGLDPAVVSSPVITTLVDALSLLVYFGVATALLGL